MNLADLTLQAAWFFVFEEADGTPKASQGMVDLAVSSTGEMYGVSLDPMDSGAGTHHLYRVTPPTTIGVGVARARRVGTLSFFYNALAFAPAGMVRTGEVLVGLDNESTLSTSYLDIISTVDGTSTTVGSVGSSLKSSGDLVAIDGMGMFATLKDASDATFVASLNPTAGTATVIGSALPVGRAWGLAYWDGSLLGFTADGIVMTINPASAATLQVWDYDLVFYGAAVSPLVPLVAP